METIMKLKTNASHDDVLLYDKRTGKPVSFDRSSLNKNERNAMREMLVNHWCRMRNYPTKYVDSQGV